MISVITTIAVTALRSDTIDTLRLIRILPPCKGVSALRFWLATSQMRVFFPPLANTGTRQCNGQENAARMPSGHFLEGTRRNDGGKRPQALWNERAVQAATTTALPHHHTYILVWGTSDVCLCLESGRGFFEGVCAPCKATSHFRDPPLSNRESCFRKRSIRTLAGLLLNYVICRSSRAVSGRSHNETCAGCIVSLTTPTRSSFNTSRSVSSLSLAEKASRVFLASYLLL
jgi:hypothetical protein